jgi:hypothetical protein
MVHRTEPPAMPFAEALGRKLLGPPTHFEGSCAHWSCPKCGSRKFHLRPVKAGLKDRFSCWSCDWWGDEADLLAHFYPRETWPDRQERLRRLRGQWERGEPVKQRLVGEHQMRAVATFSSPGPGIPGQNAYDRDPQMDHASEEADAAIAELLAYARDHEMGTDPDLLMFDMAAKALKLCAQYRLHPLGLAGRCDYVVWVEGTERKHRAECRDPDCDWRVCREYREKKAAVAKVPSNGKPAPKGRTV